MATHFKNPLFGSVDAGDGAFAYVPVDAFQDRDWMVYRNDFLLVRDYDATNDWTLTAITGGSAALVADQNEGILQLDCPADQQGPIIQLDKGSIGITPAASSTTAVATEAVFACRFRLLDAGASSFFVGLAEVHGVGEEVLEAAGTTAADTHAGFIQADPNTATAGAINVTAAGQTNATAVTGTAGSYFTLADNTFVEVAVRITGLDTAEFYYRPSGRVTNSPVLSGPPWARVATLTTADDWDTVMFPSIALAGSGTGDDLDVDWVVFAVKRDLTL